MIPFDLVISDVDGTLVTDDKRLPQSAIRAVRRLYEHNIGFTITSSRPPFGMQMLVEPLGLIVPIGAFNGSSIIAPDLQILQQHAIPNAAAVTGIEILKRAGVDVWLYTSDRWLIDRNEGPYVEKETKTIETAPEIVTDFGDFTAAVCKIVGVSADPERLMRCEEEARRVLDGQAMVMRSQTYYLDITPTGFDKGTFVETMARRLDIPSHRIATLGDMTNDVAMFRKSGFSFAMGNASPEVKAHASRITSSNEDDGFAKAIDELLALDS